MSTRAYKTRASVHRPTRLIDDEKDKALERNRAKRDASVLINEELDDILDEIDGLLEENAEEFVKSYVQKAGE